MQLLHDRLCLVTEWASGGTLASFLAAPRYSRGVAEDLALFIMRQLVAAVERLHENRVAYRDIKLDNILLDTTTFGAKAPRVLLADFGTCKAWEEGEAGCLASTFMGTPGARDGNAGTGPEHRRGSPLFVIRPAVLMLHVTHRQMFTAALQKVPCTALT
jgi:serine/threonine protein kinase